jgi:histone acetyltransferase (RNA polymerase elongator complex component)
MTEEEKYNQLENSFICLNVLLSDLSWWKRHFGRPSEDVKEAVKNIKKAVDVVSAHVEFCHVDRREKLVKMLRKAENKFFEALRIYPSLNQWNYELNFYWKDEN